MHTKVNRRPTNIVPFELNSFSGKNMFDKLSKEIIKMKIQCELGKYNNSESQK